ncbi:MAG: DUF5012 domain-containing protein [Bacteroides sp.]
MKKIIYSLFVCLACTLVSCEGDTTQDVSKISYFVNFEMKGDPIMQVPVGTPYVEPGVIATEGETDITASMVTTGKVDVSTIGVYTLSYSAVNVDGFSKSTERLVVVYNPKITADMSGSYKVAEGTNRVTDKSGAVKGFSGYKVNISKLAPGVFEVSDFIAGYYDQGSAYGPAYALKGTMKLNEDNTLSALDAHLSGWNDSYTRFEKAMFNPVTGAVNWTVGYSGFTFNVSLTK